MCVCLSVSVYVCVLRYFVSPITHEPLIGHMFQRLHVLRRGPNKNFFINWWIPGILLKCLIKIYRFFQKKLNATTLTKTTSLITFQYQTLLRGKKHNGNYDSPNFHVDLAFAWKVTYWLNWMIYTNFKFPTVFSTAERSLY